ncbi:hypothetical protein CA606_18570 [Caulobacter vibrioides]|uniref:Uncharacterized protein n=1 Tax=Caulobacter vibrioides TaxID=155892 RepID=A0A290N2K0_CAUVI|nr:hypothetical protein [Caulobacter vibrioides]ATC34175.1 hypothetical protein CA606_18570 [Caulobacter vibrioides]
MWTVKLDAHGYLLADAIEVVDLAAPCLPGWTFVETEPPAVEPGAFARLGADGAWSIDLEAPPVTVTPLPAEVPMHKILKAALITPWPGFDNLDAAIRAAFASLPHPKSVLALAEYARAQNFVTAGVTTESTKAALGMSDQQFRDLVILADSMA